MNRTWRVALLAALFALGLAGPAAAEDDDTGWTIERFDAALTITPDGSVQVVEEIGVDFAGLERHGIFRVIPVEYPAGDADLPEGRDADEFRRVIQIADVQIESSAPPDLERSREGGDLVLRIGDPDTTVTGPQTYTLRYTVRGALTATGGGGELRWNATGNDWPVPIAAASATVSAPEVTSTACAQGPEGSPAPCTQERGPGDPRFAASDLAPGEGLTVTVGFPARAVTVPPPIIEERWTLPRALAGSPAALPLTALTAVARLGGVALLARRGRDEADPGAPAVASGPGPRFAPPDGLRPAQLRAVLEEKADGASLTATLLDLAARGFLEIERLPGGDGRKGPDWRLRRREADPASLLDYERHVLDALFDERDYVVISGLQGTFWQDYQGFRDRVYSDAVEHGWYRRSPASTRNRWLAAGLAALVVAVVLLVLALVFTTLAAAAVPLVLAAVALLVVHRSMPSRTADGRRLLDETRGYRDVLKSSGAPQADPAAFARDLPYAIAFGAAPDLVRRFTALGLPAQQWMPVWYHSPTWHGDPSALSDDMAAFAGSVDTTMTTAPASSSSSSGASSGGGFGGGGGGSW